MVTASQPLPTTDTAASLGRKTVGDLFSAATSAAETAFIVAYPPLGFPGFKQIWEFIFESITSKISFYFGLETGYIIIDVQEYFALKSAATAMAALKAAQASGDPNAIAQANQDVDNAVAPVLHYIGSVQS